MPSRNDSCFKLQLPYKVLKPAKLYFFFNNSLCFGARSHPQLQCSEIIF